MSDNPNSVVRQDSETFKGLIPVALGVARQMCPRFNGDVVFEISKGESLRVLEFLAVSSVMYFDEFLTNENNYPYIQSVEGNGGFYQVQASSYLRRIREDMWISAGMYDSHKHYIYFDKEFNWHITSFGIKMHSLDDWTLANS